jgi:hypothetical protein
MLEITRSTLCQGSPGGARAPPQGGPNLRGSGNGCVRIVNCGAAAVLFNVSEVISAHPGAAHQAPLTLPGARRAAPKILGCGAYQP